MVSGRLDWYLLGMNIGFLVPWPLNNDLTAYWSMWGSLATAIATVALVFFAVLAWRAALRAITSQVNSDQISALSAYVSALISLSQVSQYKMPLMMPRAYSPEQHQASLDSYQTRLDHLVQSVETSGVIWRAHHASKSGKMREFADIEYFLIESTAWWREADKSIFGSNAVTEQHELWRLLSKEISLYAAQWQVDEADRESVNELLTRELSSYLETSPLASEAAKNYAANLSKQD